MTEFSIYISQFSICSASGVDTARLQWLPIFLAASRRASKLNFMTHVGVGFDVHPLVENRKLILGGVEIPHDKGLEGHSDADVLMHAICDAILGALGQS